MRESADSSLPLRPARGNICPGECLCAQAAHLRGICGSTRPATEFSFCRFFDHEGALFCCETPRQKGCPYCRDLRCYLAKELLP